MTEYTTPTYEGWLARAKEREAKATIHVNYFGLDAAGEKVFSLAQSELEMSQTSRTERDRRFHRGKYDGLMLALGIFAINTVPEAGKEAIIDT